MKSVPKNLHDLYVAAAAAREKSYSPYSHCKVGAAIRTKDGKIYSGCNIENSSYGATICAERVAIHSALAEKGSVQIVDILVVTDADPPWPPCGLCRQVISEFALKNTKIHSANLKGKIKTVLFSKLLPNAFTPAYLKK